MHELSVAVVYLFGSQAQGRTTPMSDIDIGIVFRSPADPTDSLTVYTRLYDLFTDHFPAPGEMDIVFLQQSPSSFQYQVIKHGIVLYEDNPVFRADYEEQVIKEYLDFEPVLRRFSEALLSR
ncbi:MAG: nucleotidyltransferase domain-containing protein [Nitrospirae bacterium]|nr:nucleotidyltransferase domain-containing protein [Nitrospirota bacterium]